ncbi:hypothetical protein RC083_02310 [Pseudoalteromonas haloplanktis]|uniref:DUF6795 domain-containing protein n=2 Tax=Pseudoalteromonas TaxID=53246 RepID=A0ABU1B796_PSEHA|nr:DUF6795 domain-containing protein [Pseudoalteromonas haloplanktis]MDQ9090423.1 hypothetical protein [Pseudoalteromonas haloplanktis]
MFYSISTLILLMTMQAYADMFGFFQKQDYVLSAPVKGVLLSDGKPQAGVEVLRSLTYSKEYIDKSVTDHYGRFSFPEKVIRTAKPSNMFDNESVHQHIYIDDGTPEGVIIWYSIISLNPDSQTLVKLLGNLVCDIAQEPHTYDIPIAENKGQSFTIYTTCKL